MMRRAARLSAAESVGSPLHLRQPALFHKIGMTGGYVKARLGYPKKDPTHLLADVAIVVQYKAYNIDRRRLEALLHRVFAPATLNLSIEDRFGNPVRPHEWFFMPLAVIDEAIAALRDGSITENLYEPNLGRLINRDTETSEPSLG